MKKNIDSQLADLRSRIDGLQSQISAGTNARTAARNAGTAFNAAAVALSTAPATIATSPALTIQGSGKFIVTGAVGATTGAGFTNGTVLVQAQVGSGPFAPYAQASLSGPISETASGSATAVVDLSANPIGTTIHFALSAILAGGTATVPNGNTTLAEAGGLLTWQEIPA